MAETQPQGGRPVFIVGYPRSGTTLLRIMLIQSPQLHIPIESGFLPALKGREEAYGDFSTVELRRVFIDDLKKTEAVRQTLAFEIFDIDEDEAERRIEAVAPTNYPGAVRSLYEAAAAHHGKPRWGDKTPRYLLHLPWLGGVFPDAQFVHIIRDGRPSARSQIKAGWFDNYTDAAKRWVNDIGMGRKAGEALGKDRYKEIRYEDLIEDTEGQLRDLCAWLDLDFCPEMLQYYQSSAQHIHTPHRDLFKLIDKPVDATRVNAWKTEMDAAEVVEFERVAGPLLADLGYEPQNDWAAEKGVKRWWRRMTSAS